jgi:hypothetical protein
MRLFAYQSGAALLLNALISGAILGALLLALGALQPAEAATGLPIPLTDARVADVHYLLDANNPARIDAVELRLAGVSALTPRAVRLQVGELGPPVACAPAGERWRCPLPGTAVQSAATLRLALSVEP